MSDCIFCKIVSGGMPAEIIYEDEHTVAFRDINPQAPAHFLVIPRKHIAYLTDLEGGDLDLMGRVFNAINRAAEKLGISDTGFRVVSNCKRDGEQLVFHIHFHVLGGRQMTWPPG